MEGPHGPHRRDERIRPRGRSRHVHEGRRHAGRAERDGDAAHPGARAGPEGAAPAPHDPLRDRHARGATYYERVVRLLADLADIESSTRLSQGKPAGRVRVETPAAIGTMVVLPALAEFYRDYPDVEVELGVGN